MESLKLLFSGGLSNSDLSVITVLQLSFVAVTDSRYGRDVT